MNFGTSSFHGECSKNVRIVSEHFKVRLVQPVQPVSVRPRQLAEVGPGQLGRRQVRLLPGLGDPALMPVQVYLPPGTGQGIDLAEVTTERLHLADDRVVDRAVVAPGHIGQPVWVIVTVARAEGAIASATDKVIFLAGNQLYQSMNSNVRG